MKFLEWFCSFICTQNSNSFSRVFCLLTHNIHCQPLWAICFILDLLLILLYFLQWPTFSLFSITLSVKVAPWLAWILSILFWSTLSCSNWCPLYHGWLVTLNSVISLTLQLTTNTGGTTNWSKLLLVLLASAHSCLRNLTSKYGPESLDLWCSTSCTCSNGATTCVLATSKTHSKRMLPYSLMLVPSSQMVCLWHEWAHSTSSLGRWRNSLILFVKRRAHHPNLKKKMTA